MKFVSNNVGEVEETVGYGKDEFKQNDLEKLGTLVSIHSTPLHLALGNQLGTTCSSQNLVLCYSCLEVSRLS